MNRLTILIIAMTCSMGCTESQTPNDSDLQTASAQKSSEAESNSPKESATDPPTASIGVENSLSTAETPKARGPNERTAQPKSKQASNEPADRVAALEDVFEALFRHQFKNNGSAAQQSADAYFLQINRKDPSPEFLKRFAGHTPPVKDGSELAIGKGLLFRIDSWKWVSDSEIELTGGYYEDGLSSSGNQYLLVRKNGKWVIEKDELRWVS